MNGESGQAAGGGVTGGAGRQLGDTIHQLQLASHHHGSWSSLAAAVAERRLSWQLAERAAAAAAAALHCQQQNAAAVTSSEPGLTENGSHAELEGDASDEVVTDQAGSNMRITHQSPVGSDQLTPGDQPMIAQRTAVLNYTDNINSTDIQATADTSHSEFTHPAGRGLSEENIEQTPADDTNNAKPLQLTLKSASMRRIYENWRNDHSPPSSFDNNIIMKNSGSNSETAGQDPSPEMSVIPVSNQSTGTLPVRFVIETSERWRECPARVTCHSVTCGEDYIIVPSDTPLSHVVARALLKHNLAHLQSHEFSVYVCVRNWQCVHLSDVCKSVERTTAGQLLPELAAAVTLRLVCSSLAARQQLQQLRNKLLQLVMSRGSQLLAAVDCPLDQETLRRLVFKTELVDSWLSADLVSRTRVWCESNMVSSVEAGVTTAGVTTATSPSSTSSLTAATKMSVLNSAALRELQASAAAQPVQTHTHHCTKPRNRTSFDTEYEMPKLQKWFFSNSHPSRMQMQYYMEELNLYRISRNRKPLEISNIVYWFKNARAAHKKHEQKYVESVGSSAAAAAMSAMMSRTRHAESEEPLSLSDQETDDFSGVSLSAGHDNSSSARAVNDELKLEQMDSDSSELEISGEVEPDSLNEEHPAMSSHSIPASLAASSMMMPPSYVGQMPLTYPSAVHPAMLHRSVSMYMSGCLASMPGYTGQRPLSSVVGEHQRKRNRTFIDPVSEVPLLEHWFSENTHPCHTTILQYADELNRHAYRQKFPKLEPKNVQFWFKNRRAKCRRLRSTSSLSPGTNDCATLETTASFESTVSDLSTNTSAMQD